MVMILKINNLQKFNVHLIDKIFVKVEPMHMCLRSITKTMKYCKH